MEDRQQTTSVYREEVFGTLTYKNGTKFVKMMELVGIFLNERYKHWKSWKSWRFKIELLEPYIQGLRSYEYLDAHTRAPSFVVCPKSYSRCRKGNCEHTENDG